MNRMMKGVRRLAQRLSGDARRAEHEPPKPGPGYADWLALYETPAVAPLDHASRAVVEVRVRGDNPVARERTLRSLAAQRHTRWIACDRHGLTLAHGPDVVPASADVMAGNERLVTWIDAGDQLAPDALLLVAAAFATNPSAQLVCTDDDVWPDGGARTAPRFLPDADIDLLRAGRPPGGLTVFREPANAAPPAADDGVLDRVLRTLEAAGESAAVHLPRVLLHAATDARPCGEDDWRAVEQHLRRSYPAASLVRDPQRRSARVAYPLPSPAPSVTLVMPTRNQPVRLRTAVDSIQGVTSYAPFDLLIVDNGSDRADARQALRDLAVRPGVRVERDDRPFNWSALNNAAAARATGDLLCFINDDVEAYEPAWLEALARLAVRADVGVVGARLWYPNRTLQHAGLVLHPQTGASHLFQHLPPDDLGYLGLAGVTRRVSAVTGACLVVRREVFAAVGGFDETLPSDFNDVDFCLRVGEAGLKTLWTPDANLVHHEGATRGTWDDSAHRKRFEQARRQFVARWGARLAHDPHFNPNLSLSRENPPLAWPPRTASR